MTNQPLLVRKTTPKITQSTWRLRLAFALLLVFGSELFLWTAIQRPVWHWLPVMIGYVAIATLLLDIMVRFRVKDLFGGLLLAGVYGLLASTLINPQSTLEGIPLTLLSRVMGLQTLAGALALRLLTLSPQANTRNHLIAAAFFGLVWGIWLRGYPPFDNLPDASLMLALITLSGFFAVWTILTMRPLHIEADSLRLSNIGLLSVVGSMALLLAWQMIRGAVSRDALAYLITVAVFALVVLWFQSTPQPQHLFSNRKHIAAWRMYGLMLLIFGIIGLGVFFITSPDQGRAQVELLILGVSAFGLAWLPGVSLVLGVRAYRSQVRTGRLL